VNAADETRAALEEAQFTGRDLSECERRHVGCTHAQVGGLLVEQWNFPAALQESVRYHHTPERAQLFPSETAIVHVADVVANALEWGRGGRIAVPPFHPAAWDSLGLEPSLLASFIEDAERQLDAAIHLVSG
jgi:HDOD domain